MSLKAELKDVISPDIHDLQNYHPEQPDNFGFLIELFIGHKGVDGSKCSPQLFVHQSGFQAITRRAKSLLEDGSSLFLNTIIIA